MIFPVKRLADLGFEILATEGTADVLRRNGVEADRGAQAQRTAAARTASRPSSSGSSTARSTWWSTRRPGRGARADGYEIRAAAVAMDRPIITTVQELAAAVQGIEALGRGELGVRSLQDWTRRPARRRRGTR